jgi:uncharacterized membrane protein
MRSFFIVILILCVLNVLNNTRQLNRIDLMTTENKLSYKRDVLPIIENRCKICHNAGTPERNWLDYKTAYNKRSIIKLRLENRTMPIGITMLETERKLMIEWVKQGAKK